jgi:hypothetical protein
VGKHASGGTVNLASRRSVAFQLPSSLGDQNAGDMMLLVRLVHEVPAEQLAHSRMEPRMLYLPSGH